MILTKAGVTVEADKKDMVVQYVDMELEDVWSSYPEFKDQMKSYNISACPRVSLRLSPMPQGLSSLSHNATWFISAAPLVPMLFNATGSLFTSLHFYTVPHHATESPMPQGYYASALPLF